MLEESLFKNILASLRVRRGWTQLDAVAHTGISRTALHIWRTQMVFPLEKQLKNIATVFILNQEDTDTLYRAARQAPPKIHNLPSIGTLLHRPRARIWSNWMNFSRLQ